jgi:tetratricopeptide (TPR) repeat protein
LSALAAADVAIYQNLGDRLGEAESLRDLGRVRYLTDDYAAAGGVLERALAIYQDFGDRVGETGVLRDLGRVRRATGDLPAAAALLEQALAAHRNLGDRIRVGRS